MGPSALFHRHFSFGLGATPKTLGNIWASVTEYSYHQLSHVAIRFEKDRFHPTKQKKNLTQSNQSKLAANQI